VPFKCPRFKWRICARFVRSIISSYIFPYQTQMTSFSERASPRLVIIGTFIDTPSPRTLRVRRNHFCVVSPTTGKITQLAPFSSEKELVQTIGAKEFRESTVVWLTSSQFVCPGMIDTHCHAPQYRQLGFANNLPLVSPLRELLR
jgi:cytosine/adenosine deaminase-related metal-dependent hydrolase